MLLGDCESTGVDPHRDRIVTFALIEGGRGQKPLTHNWLINPGIPISDGAAKVHGITNQHAQAHGRPPQTAIREIAEQVLSATASGVPFIGFNCPFDLTMLWAETMRHCPDLSDPLRHVAPVIDPFVLDKWADKWRKGSRKLIDVARHYGIELSEQDAHGAEADALAAGRVAWAIANKWPGATGPAMAVHALCVEQKRAQAESFGAYLVKQGKPDDVSRDFPIQPPPPGWTPEQLPEPREPERKSA
jgi:DNA polymerase-3 subunit epsilon